MDNRAEVKDFLTSRRNRLTPELAGLSVYGSNRRVQGLRRTEVAALAGVSVEYYTRMERGNLAGVSGAVLDAVARALHLDEAERGHLFDLARTAAGGTTRRTPRPTVRPSIGRILDGMTGVPAYVRNARMDVLAANSLCMALYGGILTPQTLPLNLARFMFLDQHAHEFFLDWDAVADDFVATLRTESGRSPLDRKLSDLVGELATRSDEFRVRWARHNVRLHRTTVKRLRNPVIGDIELTCDALDLTGDNLAMITYTAEAGSPAQEQLEFLASWSTDHTALPPARSLGSEIDGEPFDAVAADRVLP
ncbi:helix-turn-helix transcriptional regulator [Hamadaea tsunoensis]|uniref:helix-turn-helix transcriptional regulator n=1 Tax=Hamadaea tsunoensis TaxID=53368 RepID=UPI00041044C6|nr:helix-turn-helix transcriptional regulator [Hamadaea tsunoensis]